MSLDSEIIIVSGLPRSGTSLMMQMIDAGGIEVVSDQIRGADVDNPRGYFEFERVKQIQKDASWLRDTRGKAFKMISQLLYHLPQTERYRIVFMERNLEETLASQEKMLRRRNAAVAPRDRIQEAFTLHLNALFDWLRTRDDMKVLKVNYNDLLSDPLKDTESVNRFLDCGLAVEAMVRAVDSGLYRNRNPSPGQFLKAPQ